MPLKASHASDDSATSTSTLSGLSVQSKHAKEITGTSTATTSTESTFRQHRLSPMFSTTKISTAQAMQSTDRYRSTKVRDNISPVDGKTMSCDRSHTFDAFVPQQHLSEDKPEKRMGHTWDVIRAVTKLRKPAKKMARKASVRRSEKSSGMKRLGETDRERLLSVG